MKPFHFLHLRETKYIHLSPRQCQGCWECVKVCPKEVLVKMDWGHHRHVHIKNADACTGCKKCVRACEYAALTYTYVPGTVKISGQRLPGKESE